jgi:hypothetical protein
MIYLKDFFKSRKLEIIVSKIRKMLVGTFEIQKKHSNPSILLEPMEKEVSQRWYFKFSKMQERRCESILVHILSIYVKGLRLRIDL